MPLGRLRIVSLGILGEGRGEVNETLKLHEEGKEVLGF